MKDWEIAEASEADMKPIAQIAAELGLQGEELINMGKYLAKVDYQKVLQRLDNNGQGKYIDVTAITPTPLGEGKTTTCMGLVQGLGIEKVHGAAVVGHDQGRSLGGDLLHALVLQAAQPFQQAQDRP